MGIAEELLQLSDALVYLDHKSHQQASFRRSVSTAYYAVFHLLTSDAAQRWDGTTVDRGGLERGFDHRAMRTISSQIAGNTWKDSRGSVPSFSKTVRIVARAFVDLQIDRHSADYDNQRVWSQTQAENIVARAIDVFQKWKAVRTEPEAGTYLLAMLLGKQR